MVGSAYVPDRGDIVWVNFNPTRGHEQKGKRPALVLSSKFYNTSSGLAVVVPITAQIKGYPFEVSIEAGSVQGVVLADQLRSVDWHIRRMTLVGRVPGSTIAEIQKKISALLL